MPVTIYDFTLILVGFACVALPAVALRSFLLPPAYVLPLRYVTLLGYRACPHTFYLWCVVRVTLQLLHCTLIAVAGFTPPPHTVALPCCARTHAHVRLRPPLPAHTRRLPLPLPPYILYIFIVESI